MDDSTAIYPSQLPQRTHIVVVPESDWEKAVVKWFNRLRGFGFSKPWSQDADIFVHMETLRRMRFFRAQAWPDCRATCQGTERSHAGELKPDHASGPSSLTPKSRRRFIHSLRETPGSLDCLSANEVTGHVLGEALTELRRKSRTNRNL